MEPELLGGKPITTTRETVISWIVVAATLGAAVAWPRVVGPMVVGLIASYVAIIWLRPPRGLTVIKGIAVVVVAVAYVVGGVPAVIACALGLTGVLVAT